MLGGVNLKSEFLKSVVLLTSGTVLAQLIHFGFQPVISRLFNPEEIEELNVFLRIVAFFVAIGTARYELAIPLPKEHKDAFQIYRATLKILFFVILSLVVGGLIYALFSPNLHNNVLYILALAVVIFVSVFRNLGLNFSIRKKWFKAISISKTLGALTMSLAKVGAGLLKMGSLGLIIATIIGVFGGTIIYLKQFFQEKGKEENNANKSLQYNLLKEHKDFPMMNLPHTLIDAGRELIIVYIFLEYFEKGVFGSYSYALMIMGLPLALIGTTIGQAFFQKASEQYNNRVRIGPLIERTTKTLALLSIVPFSIIYFYGEEIFTWFFSEKWNYAGQIVEVLTPWVALKFISSPISTIPLIIKKQRVFFVLGLINTILQLGLLYFLPLYMGVSKLDVLKIVEVISIVMALYLVVIVFVKLSLVRKSDKITNSL